MNKYRFSDWNMEEEGYDDIPELICEECLRPVDLLLETDEGLLCSQCLQPGICGRCA